MAKIHHLFWKRQQQPESNNSLSEFICQVTTEKYRLQYQYQKTLNLILFLNVVQNYSYFYQLIPTFQIPYMDDLISML